MLHQHLPDSGRAIKMKQYNRIAEAIYVMGYGVDNCSVLEYIVAVRSNGRSATFL